METSSTRGVLALDYTPELFDAASGNPAARHVAADLAPPTDAQVSAGSRPAGRLFLAPDGATAATVAPSGETVQVWDARTGRLRRNLTGHGGPVRGVVYTAGGRTIVTVGQDDTVRVWEVGG